MDAKRVENVVRAAAEPVTAKIEPVAARIEPIAAKIEPVVREQVLPALHAAARPRRRSRRPGPRGRTLVLVGLGVLAALVAGVVVRRRARSATGDRVAIDPGPVQAHREPPATAHTG